jgi:hypothetical protein
VSQLKGKIKNYLIISTSEVSMPCKGASEAMKFVARRCVLSLIILLLLDPYEKNPARRRVRTGGRYVAKNACDGRRSVVRTSWYSRDPEGDPIDAWFFHLWT